MLKKFLAVLVVLFVFTAVWAQNPTKNFPYYYYETSGGPNNCYDSLARNFARIKSGGVELENNDEWTVALYRNGTTHYLVHQYASGKAESRAELIEVLKKHKSVYKELDKKIDEEKKRNFHVCLVFIDASGQLISSALYSENY